MSKIGEIVFKKNDGKDAKLGDYNGQVLLLVNVASKCGLTPQYEALEKIYEKYQPQGFSVLAFPANEFGAQEPGTNDEIQEFCRGTFGVKFPVMQKIVVKGEGQHPLYHTLTATKPSARKNPDGKLEANLAKHGVPAGKPGEIMWNFEKFLVNRKGEVIERFAPDVVPDDPTLLQAIETALKN